MSPPKSINGITDPSKARLVFWGGVEYQHAPADSVGYQPEDAGLTDIAGLAVTDGNIIVGNGTNWVAESGNTARTSIGLGTGDSPTLTALTLSNGQLVFPAVQVPSAGANTLDDYEEGTYTPTVTASVGTFTTVSATGVYTKIGRVCWYTVIIVITTNGTAAGLVRATLPFTSTSDETAYGRETQATGMSLNGEVSSGGTVVSIADYTGAYPGGSSRRLRVSGRFNV